MDKVSVGDIGDGAAALRLDPAGVAALPLVVVDLDTPGPSGPALRALAEPSAVTIGVSSHADPSADPALLAALTCTILPGPVHQTAPITCVRGDDPVGQAAELVETARANPTAALALASLLRLNAQLSVSDGIRCESFVYSMLLAGPEFAAWRAGRPNREVDPDPAEAVLLNRSGGRLDILLNRPRRHNAYSREVRDALIDALAIAELDKTVTDVHLAGAGASFCSGGDLDEFGTTPDVTAADLIRVRQNAGAAVHRAAGKVRVTLHGACVGAGIEIAAFAGCVEAQESTRIRLPELAMGLVPGAGGTVSLPRRIGRWRTAYLVLSGHTIGRPTALAWGLVDVGV